MASGGLSRRVGELAPGLVVGDLLRRTGKSAVVAGAIGDTPVVVKLLLGDDPFWRAKLGREIDAYRIFAEHRPPVRVPRMIHTDGARLLVLERLEGQPLHAERHPDRSLPEADVNATLDALAAFHAWRPPRGVFAPMFDYARRIRRYRDDGPLTGADAEALRGLLARWTGDWEMNHGDPVPSNLFIAAGGVVALLDWEFAGWCRPGFDLALLHVLLAGTPHARARIERTVMARQIEVPFAINLAIALARELRIHRELDDGDRRVALLEALWEPARERLRTLAAGPP